MDKVDFTEHLDTLPKPKIGEDNNEYIEYDADELWKSTKENLKLMIGNREFSGIFGNSYVENVQNGIVQISCDASYKREKILKDYKTILKNALLKSSGRNFEIEINLREKDTPQQEKYQYHDPSNNQGLDLFTSAEREEKQREDAIKKAQLNPKYLFSNFIVGSNNRLAAAVAEAVVKDLGSAYNPVFFYGNTGVGKTHLMQAIGNEIIKENPNKKVVYISIEQFLNEMVEAIRTKRNEDFRNKYRAVDLLMIDDVQFVETYPRTQEELFHTFNTLYQANKQIILASDRPPKEIKNITDRLRSRFEGGMVADIQPPDYETRMAILKQAVIDKNINVEIPQEYLDMIAKNIETNVRELEGALTKVSSLIKLGLTPTRDDVAKLLQVDIDSKRKRITPSKVISAVSDVFGVKTSEIKGSRRTAYVAQCRQIVMYILRRELSMPLEKVAKEVNRNDHTTVIHACEKIEKLYEKDSRIRGKLDECYRMIKE
ncbi:MAG: chromosomal replication initiator protein DnaA [Candidatus Dojkabacteria bacterium]|nr:chromosomal replication initiator protein DnaA [Candidatus Dojkabacteria bacterium]